MITKGTIPKNKNKQQSTMVVKFKKLSEQAKTPTQSNPGDAGFDLISTRVIWIDDDHITYGTDIAVEIPEGYVGLLFPRSSIRKYSLSLSNSVGVIDSGYRGEIQCTFNRTNSHIPPASRRSEEIYEVGDKIAQLVIMPYPSAITMVEADELSDTVRGTGGFGSTGK